VGRVADPDLPVQEDRDRDLVRGLALVDRDREPRDYCRQDQRGHRPDVRPAVAHSSVAADSATRRRRKAR
jgi:hypothetical protein